MALFGDSGGKALPLQSTDVSHFAKRGIGAPMDISGYLNEIRALSASKQTTEHSFRPALERLFKSIAADLTVINEPKQSAVGAPDFVNRGH